MSRIIEIIGSPGSGKSFVCSELEAFKKDNKQIFFWSSNYDNLDKYKSLSFFFKIFIRFKAVFIIIIFYLIFFKRFFLKKTYKGNFFFGVISLFYEHLVCIESLKKTLLDNEYLITEPGPIMYFLQDYFYVNENLTEMEIKIFNKIFLNTNYIIHLNCNSDLLINRLMSRKRGLPKRMRDLDGKEIEFTIKQSINIVKNYVEKTSSLNTEIINIDSSSSAPEIRNKLINFIK
jgi:hypothetical protein